MPRSLDALITRLESAKSRFGRGAAAESQKLLDQLERRTISDPKLLLRFHETLLFLRAFPSSKSIVPKLERLLDTFHLRIERIRASADMSLFDDFDTSGLAGTTMQDELNFDAARWLVRSIPHNVEIAWDDYQEEYEAERPMGSTWPRFIPLLSEDADVEANIPWRQWLDAARGREHDIAWLIRQFDELPADDRLRAELYNSLRIPLRWRLENLKLSRTRHWTRPRHFFIHREPLITRAQVSLADELAKPAPRLVKLSLREGEKVINQIKEIMLVRYRELYGTTLGDPRSVVRADLDRGIVIHLWNLPPPRRLPLRAYVAGFTLKNGVPINYVEAIGLCEWIEVGFNTFYTYRQGETAWIYAQALRCLQAFTGATMFSIYPYQIGQNNDEALDSGAFWFYRKLGFRPGGADLEELARREEQKIAANPQYRTPRKTLKRLADAHLFYEVETANAKPFTESETAQPTGKGTSSTRADMRPRDDAALAAEGRRADFGSRSASSAAIKRPRDEEAFIPGLWDTFSTRNLALHINHRMAREFHGDATKIRTASVNQIARNLHINPARWTTSQRHSLENWSLILALIPDLARWSSEEKRDLVQLIQSQSSPNEMRYLCLTQRHARLRKELLRLGSSAPGASSN